MKRLALACVLVFASGCSELARPGATQLLPIDSRLSLRLHEDLGPAGRRLWLYVKTERTYGCANYQLVHRITRAGSAIAIQFTGVAAPSVCLTALGPASTRIDLGAVSGSYSIRVTVRGQTLNGQLEATADAFVLSALEGEWTRVETPVLRRVPEDTIWGLIGFSSESRLPAVAGFLDSLQAIGAGAAALAPGNYSYFQVDSRGEIEPPQGHGYYLARAFVYHYAGEEAALPGVVGAFADSLSISLYTDRGSRYLSWVIQPLSGSRAS